jgi:hypothetical protein
MKAREKAEMAVPGELKALEFSFLLRFETPSALFVPNNARRRVLYETVSPSRSSRPADFWAGSFSVYLISKVIKLKRLRNRHAMKTNPHPNFGSAASPEIGDSGLAFKFRVNAFRLIF